MTYKNLPSAQGDRGGEGLYLGVDWGDFKGL